MPDLEEEREKKIGERECERSERKKRSGKRGEFTRGSERALEKEGRASEWRLDGETKRGNKSLKRGAWIGKNGDGVIFGFDHHHQLPHATDGLIFGQKWRRERGDRREVRKWISPELESERTPELEEKREKEIGKERCVHQRAGEGAGEGGEASEWRLDGKTKRGNKSPKRGKLGSEKMENMEEMG